jgi:hypothetical protein
MATLLPGSDPAAGRLAASLAWLWRLGPLLDAPRQGAVAVGGVEDADEFAAALAAGHLAGAIVCAPDPGPALGPLPSRRATTGPTRFERLGAVCDAYPVLEGGTPVVRSDRGPVAVESEGMLILAVEPDLEWGRFGMHWVLEACATYLLERIDRPLALLPAVGLLRIDDLPGNAQQQAEGRAKGDRRQRARMRRYVRTCERGGAVLNTAVPAEAFVSGEDRTRVPLDQVWPGSIGELRKGAAAGAIEPVCHGLLHLDTEELAAGRIEFREFAKLDKEEAGRRIDRAMAWQREAIGPPRTFVAAAWAYSEGASEAVAERGIPSFRRCTAGAVYESGRAYETLRSGEGIFRLDYRPLGTLAALGLPPTLVMHGTLIDARGVSTRLPADGFAAARLYLRRDLSRLPLLDSLRWVAAGEYMELLDRHSRVEFGETGPSGPAGTMLRLRDRDGVRELTL